MPDAPPVLLRPWLGGLRDLVAQGPAVFAIAGESIYVGAKPASATGPLVVLSRVGGGMRGDTYDAAMIQAAAWADNGALAEELIAAVVAWLASRPPLTPLADGVQLMAASLNSLLWVPDPVTATPRYVATLDVDVRVLS